LIFGVVHIVVYPIKSSVFIKRKLKILLNEAKLKNNKSHLKLLKAKSA